MGKDFAFMFANCGSWENTLLVDTLNGSKLEGTLLEYKSLKEKPITNIKNDAYSHLEIQ